MGVLSIDRRVCVELLDARGNVVLHGGRGNTPLLRGTLHEVPARFARGLAVQLRIIVGDSPFEVQARVIHAQPAIPGAQVYLEVLTVAAADVSLIEPFDLQPLGPMDAVRRSPRADGGPTPPFGVTASLPPQMASEEDEPTGIVGTLKEMPVSDIVQSLEQNRKDALVDVKAKDREAGTLGMVAGRLVFARTATKVGDEAFFELVGATRGAFRIHFGRRPEATNIIAETPFLLLEGMRRLDEERDRGAPPPAVEAAPPEAVPSPAALTASGKFSRFFDEAGVETPPPVPQAIVEVTQRFSSLHVRSLDEDQYDADSPDSDVTSRDRKPRKSAGEHSDPPHH